MSPRHTSRRRACALTLAVVLGAVALAGCDVRRYTSGWAPYWSPTTSTTSFTENEPLFEEVSPFWFHATGARSIEANSSPAGMTALVDAAREAGVPVLPSITDGTGRLQMASILADRTQRRQHVRAIVDLVVDNGYDGIDLDYEGFAFADGRESWAATRPHWARFVEQLADALHQRNKLLSVTVPPIWDDGASGYTVYAWPEIADHVDRLRIMTYDWSFGAPGPIGPQWWVEETLAYARTVIEPSKVQIGLPAYGREWTARRVGTCPADQLPATESHTLVDIEALVQSTGATPTRDPASGEMTFRYNVTIETHLGRTPRQRPRGSDAGSPRVGSADTLDLVARARVRAVRLRTCVVTREVWYQDATAFAERARVATAAGAGVAIWALGFETPTEWAALASVGDDLTGPAGTAPIGDLETARRRDDGIRVVGWAFDPEGDLPVTVRITVTDLDDPDAVPVDTRHLARLQRDDVAADNPGAGEFHGFDLVVDAAGDGPHRVCLTALGRYEAPDSTAVECRTVT